MGFCHTNCRLVTFENHDCSSSTISQIGGKLSHPDCFFVLHLPTSYTQLLQLTVAHVCFLLLQLTVAPLIRNMYPDMDLWSSRSPAQSASEYLMYSFKPCWCRVDKVQRTFQIPHDTFDSSPVLFVQVGTKFCLITQCICNIWSHTDKYSKLLTADWHSP